MAKKFVGGINIEGQAELAEAIKQIGLAEATLDKIATRAVNRTLSHARTFATRDIGSQVNLPAKKIRETITILKARRGKPSGALRVRKRALLLSPGRFGIRELKRGGISLAVKKGGERKKIKDAFVINVRRGSVDGGGAKAVAARAFKGGATRNQRVGRTPLHVFHGPSPDQLFKNYTRTRTQREANQFLLTEFDRLAAVELARIWTR